MWPWEHLALGYVLYSAWTRLYWNRSPTGEETLALALATQVPDLIDKPLSWGLGLFPTGYAIGHSLAFAVPFVAGTLLAASRRGRLTVGGAVVVGYGSHLVGDVLSPFLSGGDLGVERLLWPFVSLSGYQTDYGFLERTGLYFGRYLHAVAESGADPSLLLSLGVMLAVVGLWIADGAPGVRELVRFFRPPTASNR